MAEKIVQTAGRNQLGEFAPMFAHLNDDVLFGEVWNEEAIGIKTKCIVTVVSLMASGISMLSNVVQPLNASLPMDTTDGGSDTLSRRSQRAKHSALIDLSEV